MYKVKINNEFQFDIHIDKTEVTVNDKPITLDSISINKRLYSVLYHNKSYLAEIITLDRLAKTCKLKINGDVYDVVAEDQYDQLLKQLGMDSLATNKVSETKAPMPGLVLSILVEEDMEVKKGDNLLILEAMKMENILKSSADGVVKKVLVKKGDKVEKNQILVQYK